MLTFGYTKDENDCRPSDSYPVKYNKHPLIRNCGLRTSWQKFAPLIPKNTRTCLAKQDQAGSYMWVTLKL